MADTILPGYGTQWGNKNVTVIDHLGPASYATGGETLTAAQFGYGGIEVIVGSMDASSTYFVEAIHPGVGGAPATIKLQWFTMNGTEVSNATNLSTKSVRLIIVGV